MDKTKLCFFIMMFFTLILLLVGFATKAAHWDKLRDKTAMKESLSEVYPALEGLIVLDVFLFLGSLIFIQFVEGV